jgi:WD40 repeat protein
VARVTGGHTSVINSVSWSPIDPQLFVTASDDHTLRLWSTESTPQAEIVTDSKDLKRIDCLKTGAPSSRIYMNGLHSDEYQSESSEENRP